MSYHLHIELEAKACWLFFVSSLILFKSRKGAKFIQMKFHGTCLDKQTDLNRFLTRELAATTARSKDPFVKFVRLFIQVKNSATSLDRQRSYGADTAPCSRHSVSV